MNIALLARARRVVDSEAAAPPEEDAPGTPDSYWAFDSIGATVADDVGSRPLTVVGSPGTVAGKNSSALENENGSNYAESSSASFQYGNSSFSMRVWVKYAALVTNSYIIDKYDAGPQTGFRLICNSTVGFRAEAASAGFGSIINSNIIPDLETWYMLIFYYDSVNDRIGLSVNGAAFLLSNLQTVGVGAPTATLKVGSTGFITVDECAVWDGQVLTDSNAAYEYNSGAGIFYS